MKYGIENIKEAIVIFIKLGHAVEVRLEDNKITLMEGITFVPKLWSIKKLWDDRVAVVNQAKDIDAAEKVEINAFVAAELDLKNDKVEAIIEKTIEAILETTGVIDKIVELRNLIQEAKEAS